MKGSICPDISIPYYSIRGPHDLQWDPQKKTNFFGPGGRLNISFVCFSRRNRSCNCKCWMKTLKTKIQFEIPHLAFLCQNKKKTQYAFKCWKCYATLRIIFTLSAKKVRNKLAESQICFATRLPFFGVELNLKNKVSL